MECHMVVSCPRRWSGFMLTAWLRHRAGDARVAPGAVCRYRWRRRCIGRQYNDDTEPLSGRLDGNPDEAACSDLESVVPARS
jgi:hypothetical protein